MRIRLCFLLLACLLSAGVGRAQSSITLRDTVTPLTVQSHSQVHGRNFWFAPILNPHVSDYFLFITGGAPATAYVQLPGEGVKAIPVSPNTPTQYVIPWTAILQTSDTIERRAIHVWCNTADIYLALLPAPAMYTDGTNIPPVTAWDTDYVIAAGPRTCKSSYVTITASTDSTSVLIEPTCDIERSTATKFKLSQERYKPFVRTLMRGEAVQFWTYTDTSFSGTRIHSNRPIGVMTGSSYSATGYIPHCEAMLPSRAWGNTYYTARYGRTSVALVASKDTQYVQRYDRFQGGIINTWMLAKKGDFVWADLIDSGSRWESDAPFMMELYTTPFGGPSVTLEPQERFKRVVQFHVPTNYSPTMNVFVNTKAGFATLDGEDLRGRPHIRVDSFYDCYTFVLFSSWGAGAHELRSDSTIGAYITSTNQYNSSAFAYWMYNGPVDNNAQDTTPPLMTFDTSHYCIDVHIADHASRLGGLLVDTARNFAVSLANYNVLGRDSTDLSICLIDSLEPASFSFTVLNQAGNGQRYSISYVPDARFFHPGFTVEVRGLDSCLEDQYVNFTIETVDTSLMRVEIDNIWTDSPYFIFDRTSLADNALPTNLLPNAPHKFTLRFAPTESKIYSANAYIHSPFAGTQQIPLTGIGYPWVVGPIDEAVEEETSGFAIYPNPATSFVAVSHPEEEATFELFNTLGERVISQRLRGVSEHDIVDLSTLPSAMYAYRIQLTHATKRGALVLARQ